MVGIGLSALSAMSNSTAVVGISLMIIIPLVTILGILFMRQDHSLHTTFDGQTSDADMLMFLTKAIAIQFTFLGLGLVVLLRQGYFRDFVSGSNTSPGTYALVCPGVALTVMLQFFVNKGLLDSGMIDKYSVTFWVATGIAITFQFAMVWLVLRLNRQHFASTPMAAVIPAE